jgi:hypothetical protein
MPPRLISDNLGAKSGIGTGFILQETGIQPVTNIAFRHAVQTTALSHLHGGFILWTRCRFMIMLSADDG